MEDTQISNTEVVDETTENEKKNSSKQKRKPSIWALHILFYLIGLAVLALGVSISRQAGLGLSQLVILPSVFSRIDARFNADLSHDMGWWVGIVFIIFVIIQMIVLRKDFKPIQLLQIPISLLYGFLIGTWNGVVASMNIPMPNYLVQLFFSILGVVIMGIGISIYLTTDVVPLSSEGAPLAIAKKSGKPFPRVKQIFDLSLVALAIIASLIGLSTIYGEDVREGTIIAAVCLGPLIALANKFTAPIKKFLNRDK